MNIKCQVFTPQNYVNQLLDSIDYRSNLYGKRILENSCGDGNILVEIVKRYIIDCKSQGLSDLQIIDGLKRDICGVEIDKTHYNKCIERLNEILVINNLDHIDWNILNEDFLKKGIYGNFDYVVGNPPYITYADIKEADRAYLRNSFSSCKYGKFDYCYAFIEKSIKCLKSEGQMSYLVPSSIFKTVFGSELRQLMLPYIIEIKDFTQEKIFDNALIKSSIIILKKEQSQAVKYYDTALKHSRILNKKNLGDKWIFHSCVPSGKNRFGDYFRVSHVVATLLNKAFVLVDSDLAEDKDYYRYGEYRVEKSVLRDTATPRTLKHEIKERIIFPYRYNNGVLVRFSEDDFTNEYPETCIYLQAHLDKLKNRKIDKNTKWFEYGRSQALKSLDTKKLLISTIVTSEVSVYMLSKECIPYGGMYIVPKNDNNTYSLNEAVSILKSKSFLLYAQSIGIHISGTSVRITSKDIENYEF